MKKKDPNWPGSLRDPGLGSGSTEARSLVSGTIREWYDEKHRAPSADEIALVNAAKVTECPYCGSGRFVRDGRSGNGVRRLLCRGCGRRFGPLTNTVFDGHKIPISERIEFLLHLFEFHSVATSARDNKNAETTGRYWLEQVFCVLEGYQDGIVCAGRVYEDETLVSVDPKERARNADGTWPRGISRNKVSIAAATDGTRTVLVATSASKPSKRSIAKALGTHIEPGSTLVHDGDNSHAALIDRLHLESEVHPTAETKGMDDKDNPLDPVNDLHDKLKRFLRAHEPFGRDRLQDWLNLFAFIWNPPDSRYDKVALFIDMAVSTRRRVRYRDVFARKEAENRGSSERKPK